MEASLDTDIVIHLYISGQQDLLHDFFEHLHIHEYLLNSELKKVAPSVYSQVIKDIYQGLIDLVTTTNLIAHGIKGLFESYLRDNEILFDSGELHAVALAKTLGLTALLSDDTKEFGPHDLLQRELIADVIPFSACPGRIERLRTMIFQTDEWCPADTAIVGLVTSSRC